MTINPTVSFLETFESKPHDVQINDVLEKIRIGTWEPLVSKLRKLPMDSGDYTTQKRKLPSFLISARTSPKGRKTTDLLEHSGLLQLDLDHLGVNDAISLRDQIGRDPYILAAWISPGGEGLKAVMRIPQGFESHTSSFKAAAQYMRERHAVKIDSSCRDAARLCFVSWDPAMVLNPAAEILPIPEQIPEPITTNGGFGKIGDLGGGGDASLSSLNIQLYLYNKQLGKENHFSDFPNLKPLFQNLVSRRYPAPKRGERNDTIIDIAAMLYHAISPRFIPEFISAYHQLHEDVFKDYSIKRVVREVSSLLKGADRNYRDSLTDNEKKFYAALDHDERLRVAFRIFRSLSRCDTSDETPPGFCFMSCRNLGTRLGLQDVQAGRILKSMQNDGILKMISRGTRWKKGRTAKASVFQWLPGTPNKAF